MREQRHAPTRTKIDEKGRSLDHIFRGDILVLPDREETARVVDRYRGVLINEKSTEDCVEIRQYRLGKVGENYVFTSETPLYSHSYRRKETKR